MAHALSGMSAAAALARLTLVRLVRGKLLWISGFFAAAPLVILLLLGAPGSGAHGWSDVYPLMSVLVAVIPALHLAPAVAEELEDRTFTYLWSRPFPRWSLLAGKLMAMVPAVIVLLSASVVIAFVMSVGAEMGAHMGLLGRSLAGVVVGVWTAGATAMGIGSVVPRHATATAIMYLLVIDSAVGAIPFAIQNLSVSYHVRGIALDDGGGMSLVWLAAMSAVWLGVAVWRISTAE